MIGRLNVLALLLVFVVRKFKYKPTLLVDTLTVATEARTQTGILVEGRAGSRTHMVKEDTKREGHPVLSIDFG
jgi:hypothetical protein